jgi:hypothetical protein
MTEINEFITILKKRKKVLFDPDSQAFFDRVRIAGGGVSNSTKMVVNTFVLGLKADGLWTKINDMGVFAGGDLTSSLIKLKIGASSPSSLVNANFITSDYAERGLNGGLQGDGISKFLDTGFNTSNLTPSSVHLSFYSQTSLGSVQYTEIGADLSNNSRLFLGVFNQQALFDNLDQVSRTASSTDQNGQGFYIGNRVSSSDSKIFKNGVIIASRITQTGTNPNLPIYLFSRNINGVASWITARRLSFYSVGSGLTDLEAVALNNRVQALQIGLERAV